MINGTHSVRPLLALVCCHLGRPSQPAQNFNNFSVPLKASDLIATVTAALAPWECQLEQEKKIFLSDPEKDFQMSSEQLRDVKLMPVITNERLSQSKVIHGQAAWDRPVENLLIVSGYFYYVSEIMEIGQNRATSE